MKILVNQNASILWQEAVKQAEDRCQITLNEELESYLVSLLMRYSDQPDVAQEVFARTYLQAMQKEEAEQMAALQKVGDECLLFSGLFPGVAEKRLVSVKYFVELGQSAYSVLSNTANDLYARLAVRFVMLMDVLRFIRPSSDLMPLEAYQQWQDLGSKHAKMILQAKSIHSILK